MLYSEVIIVKYNENEPIFKPTLLSLNRYFRYSATAPITSDNINSVERPQVLPDLKQKF